MRTSIIWPYTLALCLFLPLAACAAQDAFPPNGDFGANPTLLEPDKSLIPTVHVAKATGWPANTMPKPAAGLQVKEFAGDLAHPRWLYVLPNGDVLVAETDAPPKPDDSKGIKGWVMKKTMQKAGSSHGSANRITLLRDSNHDGVVDTRSVFLDNLNSPFGMALVGSDFYVADTDAVVKFPYKTGETQITAKGVKLVDLPAGPLNHHWTKNIIASKDGKYLYVTVGSNSNVAENGLDKEQDRAAIHQIDLATGKMRLFASGLRNPNGMDWQGDTLWTVVNERDELGNNLVPDYMTSVKDSGFYGWPFSYYGQHVDTRVEAHPEMVSKAIKPDYALGAHTASLGLAFSRGTLLPETYRDGVFIGQHGSWNRKPFSGYKVIFVPFKNGQPSGMPQDVLSGFVDTNDNAMGRPVGVAFDASGALLVADDVGNKIWRVTPQHTE